ncbi:MAG: TonB-dependent receptor family protein [Burkholderiales bacterium]
MSRGSGKLGWEGIAGLFGLAVMAPVHAQEEAQQEAPVEAQAPEVVITGTRVEQKSFDLPMAINSIGQQKIQGEGKPLANISEQLNRVPGTVVQNREAFAQEQQITLRGFGARSQFGVRGVKLLADDIPASTPDGQGGTGLFDLGSAKRIEVLRGPFSALYGNHSGGVVQIFTEDGPAHPTLTGSLSAGSWGTTRAGLKFGGQAGGLNYLASASRFDTDGYRDHSEATKEQFNSKLRVNLGENSSLTFVLNYLNQPDNQDPLGLTAAQMASNRRGVDPGAITFNTRRSLDNLQLGGVFETKIAASDTLRVLTYVGQRSNEQYLSIPLGTQNGIRHSGGVSAFDRDFGGLGARWTHQGALAGLPLTFTTGADYDIAMDARKGYLNVNGVQGARKRDEDNTVDSWGLYGQAEWQLSEPLSLSAGLRYTRVNFESQDNFICVSNTGLCAGANAGTNPDDSGKVDHSAWTPVIGALYRLNPQLNLYANAGRSFETPTLIEMGYRSDGGAGLNFGLRPSKSNHYEVGVKAFAGQDTRIDLALFMIDTKDEIVVLTNAGGRATFQNAGDSRRQGAELAIDSNLAGGFNAFFSATWLNAEFQDAFTTCAVTPCATPNVLVRAGNKIPGVPQTTLYGEISWKLPPAGFSTGVEARWVDKVYANDSNTATAESYFVMNIRAGFEQKLGKLVLREFARVDNVLDEKYVSAVFVNDANSRFYAPAPERSYFGGFTASSAF